MKKCSLCKKTKDLSMFSKNGKTRLSNGEIVTYYKSSCKECNASKVRRERLKSKRLYLLNQWHKIRDRCNGVGHGSHSGMIYPEKELYVEWAINREDFNRIFLKWSSFDFHITKSPSIDRIDNTKGYFFENMQFIEFEKNSIKDRNKPISLSRNGEPSYFKSRGEAISNTGISVSSLYRLINGKSEVIKGWSIHKA